MTTRILWLFVFSFLLTQAGCTSQPLTDEAVRQLIKGSSVPAPSRADEMFVVDCLLPGQIRKLGRSMTYLSPRRPIKTSAQDCEIRGGEYVAYDRSDYATSLKVWLPLAQEGDKVAQTYVGEIYEKGLGLQPEYTLAATWYRKAADQGYARAQINLGQLYEKGLGVEKDSLQALSWYRQASGLRDAFVVDPASINTKAQKELAELREEVEGRKRQADALRQELARARQQLGQTQQELERRQSQVETAQHKLETARRELEQRKKMAATTPNAVELKKIEAQLEQREMALERQQQEITSLRQQLARLESESEQRRQQLAQLQTQHVTLAGPTIEIIDPPLLTRGGTPKVSARSGIERTIVGRVTAPAGLLTFTVNEREEQPDENGLFRVSMLVQRAVVPVKIVAVDKQGERVAVEFQFTPQPLAAKRPSPIVSPMGSKNRLSDIEFGNYYALIIGNQNYTYWPPLLTPEHDATTTAELLRQKYGFKIKLLLNATRYDILRALNEFRQQLTENDNLLVYYAGHGQLDNKIARGYWVPVDGEIDSNANWIPTFALTDMLSVLSAKHVLIVADSCYSGALTRSAMARLEAGKSDEARRHWLKVMAEKRSRTVLTSGDLQPVLDVGGGGHSIFARAFLNVLRENHDILEGRRLYNEVSARVTYAAAAIMTDQGPVEQIPQYAPIKYAGHESGDFFFVPHVTP